MQVTALHRESDGTWTLDVTDKAADSSKRVGGFRGIVLADYLTAKAGAVNEPQVADACCSIGINATKASAACPTHFCSCLLGMFVRPHAVGLRNFPARGLTLSKSLAFAR